MNKNRDELDDEFDDDYADESIDDSYGEEKHGGLISLLKVLMVIVVIALICLFGVIFYNIFHKKDKTDDEPVIPPSNVTTATDATPLIPDTTEIVPNGDAAEIPEESWMTGKTIYNPQITDKTIHLPVADLSLFDQEIQNEDGSDTSSNEEGEAAGPWEQVSLMLDSVEGSINYTSPGVPSKTQQLTSTYMVLVDLDTDEIVAERECDKVVAPASMTKILTVLTARDFITEENMDDTFVITREITDYVDKNDCSAVGFLPDDVVTVRDLLYGTILCSGADAALGLAEYCCGTQEAFVEQMNLKVSQLGLSETAHFTNVVGIYNDDLHCTMKDMAVILGMAVQDDLLRDVLSKRKYTTSTKYEDLGFPDGIEISNWFLRRIEDKEMNGNVIAAKTGFVNESGCCAASYYEANSGKRYICVTGNAFSSWRAIYDHVAVYRSLIP